MVVTAGLESEDSTNPGWQTVFLHSRHGFYLQFVESANVKGPTVESKVISGFSSVWRSNSCAIQGSTVLQVEENYS